MLLLTCMTCFLVQHLILVRQVMYFPVWEGLGFNSLNPFPRRGDPYCGEQRVWESLPNQSQNRFRLKVYEDSKIPGNIPEF